MQTLPCLRRTGLGLALALALASPALRAQELSEDIEAGAATKKVEKKSSLFEEEKKAATERKKSSDDALKKGEFNYERLEQLGFSKKEQELQMKKSQARRDMIKTMEGLIERSGGRMDNAADIYFRLAETWWDETHYQYLIERAEYDKVVEQFEKGLVKVKPTQPVENYQRSIEYYEKVLQQFPNYARVDEVLYRLGKAALQQGKALGDKVLSNKGVQYLNQLVQKHQSSKYIPQTHLALAEHFFEANNLTLAKMNYERITQNFKTASMYNYALYKLGWVYYNLREFRRTIETFQAVVKEIGNDKQGGKIEFRDQALKDLVQSFAELDRGWPEAKDYFTQVEGDKAMWGRLEKLAEIYVSTDKDDNAIELYTHFIENKQTDPRCIDWHEQIIDVRKKIANFPDIEAAIRKFLAFTDERTSPWVSANRQNGEYMDKQARMGESLLLYVANHYHQLAQKTEEENKSLDAAKPAYEKAAGDYKEFVRRYPNSKKAYIVNFYYAEILFDQLHDYQSALAGYKAVIERDTQGEYVEDAALGVIYSVEELMRKAHVAYKDGKWIDDPTAPALLQVNEDGKTQVVKGGKKTELTEEQIKSMQVPKKEQQLHPLEKDYVMAADKYVDLMFAAKKRCEEKKRDCGKGKKVPEIMFLAAATYYERGQYPLAIERMEKVYNFQEENKVAEIAVKTLIDIYARHRDWPKIEEWARKMLARKNRLVLDKKDLRKYVAVAVAEQAVDLAKRTPPDWDGAHAKYDTILREFRTEEPEMAAISLYNKAGLYSLQKDDKKAIETYERVVKEFPKSKIAPEAMFNIGVTYESQTAFKEAADAFLNMAKFRDNADAAQALINAGQILTALQQYKEAAAAYDKFQAVAGALKGEDENTQRLKGLVADAEMEKAHVFDKMGTDGIKQANAVYAGIATKFAGRPDLQIESLGRRVEGLRLENAAKNRKDLIKAADEAVKKFNDPKAAAGRAPFFVAQSMFYKSEYDFDDFQALTLKDVKKMTGLLPMLQKKAEALKKAEASYLKVSDQVAAGGGKAWAAASMFRVGLLYFNFKEDLFNAPIPPQIQNNDELMSAYRAEIEKIAMPIEAQSESALRNAINVAHNLGVYNKWSKEAGEYAAKVNPEAFPTVEKDPNLPKANTAVRVDKPTDAATSAAFVTSVRRGKFTVSFKPKTAEEKKTDKPKAKETGKPAAAAL